MWDTKYDFGQRWFHHCINIAIIGLIKKELNAKIKHKITLWLTFDTTQLRYSLFQTLSKITMQCIVSNVNAYLSVRLHVHEIH